MISTYILAFIFSVHRSIKDNGKHILSYANVEFETLISILFKLILYVI